MGRYLLLPWVTAGSHQKVLVAVRRWPRVAGGHSNKEERSRLPLLQRQKCHSGNFPGRYSFRSWLWEWHPTKNTDLAPAEVTAGSHQKVWWQCESGHEWQASIANRAKGRGCPYCSNRKVDASNCMAASHPKLATEWHPTKNGQVDANSSSPRAAGRRFGGYAMRAMYGKLPSAIEDKEEAVHIAQIR